MGLEIKAGGHPEPLLPVPVAFQAAGDKSKVLLPITPPGTLQSAFQ